MFSCFWSQFGNVDSNNVNDLPTYLPSEKVSLIFFKFTNMEFRKHKYFPFCEKKKKAKKQLNGKKSKFGRIFATKKIKSWKVVATFYR